MRTIVVWKRYDFEPVGSDEPGLRENHSGMETYTQVIAFDISFISCVRTIVVWKLAVPLTIAFQNLALRENHSGMETGLEPCILSLIALRENHSGMETD